MPGGYGTGLVAGTIGEVIERHALDLRASIHAGARLSRLR